MAQRSQVREGRGGRCVPARRSCQLQWLEEAGHGRQGRRRWCALVNEHAGESPEWEVKVLVLPIATRHPTLPFLFSTPSLLSKLPLAHCISHLSTCIRLSDMLTPPCSFAYCRRHFLKLTLRQSDTPLWTAGGWNKWKWITKRNYSMFIYGYHTTSHDRFWAQGERLLTIKKKKQCWRLTVVIAVTLQL